MSIRKQYDSDLESLKTALVEMGQNAAEAKIAERMAQLWKEKYQ